MVHEHLADSLWEVQDLSTHETLGIKLFFEGKCNEEGINKAYIGKEDRKNLLN